MSRHYTAVRYQRQLIPLSSDKVLEQLSEAIKDISQGAKNPDKVYFDEDQVALRLCYMLEKISHHGIKTGVFSRVTLWQYLKNLESCLPGGQSPLEWVTSSAKSDIGKGILGGILFAMDSVSYF